MPSELEIEDYINKIKHADHIYIQERDKNEHTKHRLGITYTDMVNIVRDVRVSDYYQGPMNDIDARRGGVVWVFKKEAYGENFYIKTKYVSKGNFVTAISCHIDNIWENE